MAHVQKRIILTVMCMIKNNDGSFLVQNRIKKDWPGLTFPGGHVNDNENIIDAVKREIKEETGLEIINLINKGYFEWNTLEEGVRHLCILFVCDKYKGKLCSSSEGDVFFIKENDIKKYQLSNDFMEIYKSMN